MYRCIWLVLMRNWSVERIFCWLFSSLIKCESILVITLQQVLEKNQIHIYKLVIYYTSRLYWGDIKLSAIYCLIAEIAQTSLFLFTVLSNFWIDFSTTPRAVVLPNIGKSSCGTPPSIMYTIRNPILLMVVLWRRRRSRLPCENLIGDGDARAFPTTTSTRSSPTSAAVTLLKTKRWNKTVRAARY